MSRLLVLALLLQALLIHWPSMALESGQAPVVMLLKLIETDDTAWLKQMAQKGHPIAELSLARAFRLGKGVERDPAQQLAWTQKAADQGFIWAEYEMGRLHETGEGVAANLDQALIWYRKAGVKNHIPALRRLSDLKDGADGGEGWRAMLARNEELERKYQAILGDLKSGKLTLEATVPPLEELAQAGSAKALTDLGGRQVDGRGIEKNQAEGILKLRKAESLGWSGAMYALGMVHLHGRGVERNPVQAIAFFKNASLGNYIPAFTRLAWMTESGEGVPQDLDEAVLLYRMAAEQGEAAAQRRLGELAEAGYGMARNPDLALLWYKKAAQGGDAKAKEAVARLGKTESAAALPSPPPAMAPPAPQSPPTVRKLALIDLQAMSLSADGNCHVLSGEERHFLEEALKDEAGRQNKPVQTALEEGAKTTANWICNESSKKAIQGGLRASAMKHLQTLQSKDAEVKFWLAIMPTRLINRRCGFFGEESAVNLDRFSSQLDERIQSRSENDPVLSIVIPLAEEEYAGMANKTACDAQARQRVESALKFANGAAKKGPKEY